MAQSAMQALRITLFRCIATILSNPSASRAPDDAAP
jgi:hypothetical protein